jgi:hypothetical protein
MLAVRITSAVADVINPNQTGFLPGRHICANTHTTMLI